MLHNTQKELSYKFEIVTQLFFFQVWDATSSDPKLLVFLKSYRNTVPVPRHWCQKRKFLQVSYCIIYMHNGNIINDLFLLGHINKSNIKLVGFIDGV